MNILSLDYTAAKKFFLEEEKYFTFDLPKYFKFSNLLNQISEKLKDKNLSDFYDEKQKPESCENVNYKLLNNKDGKYAWRLFQLIHPVLYIALVHKITKEKNWDLILKKFKEFQSGVVECISLPVLKSNKQKSSKACQIITWWEEIEQKSIALSLEYEYIFHTDIVDCYGSIYTHSIPWALHSREIAKKKRNDKNLLGNIIDKLLQQMANGQTNGIPQGSILMDFIAEIVLGYADQKLTKKLKNIPKEYEIIRYRDDYRIFVNNPEIGKNIIKELTNVLSNIGMRLSTEKTKCLNNVIHGSIKPDKLFWITDGIMKGNLEKQLLIIYNLSIKYPNSGTLIKELQNFYEKIEKKKKINPNLEALIAILINIAFKNPRTYPIISAILSKIFTFLKSEKTKEIINKIKTRFEKLPNTEHLDLWLQRITVKNGNNFSYQGKLCEKVENNDVEIWHSDWLTNSFKKIISSTSIVDQEEIEKMQPYINSEEISIFEKKNNYYY